MTTVIEDARRLSDSLLWRVNRRYFEDTGVVAWQTNEIPSYVTTNACMGRAYARVLFRYLLEQKARIPAGQRVHIVEIGSATGRLAYLIIRHLEEMERGSGIALPPWRFIITDCMEDSLRFCESHSDLLPYVQSGRLDFCLFDAETTTELHLRASGETLASASPLAVVANYVFDGIRQDAFRVEDGRLSEILVTLSSREAEPDLSDPHILRRMSLEYVDRPVEGPCYGESRLDNVLAHYRQRLKASLFTLPIGAFRCLDNLHRLSSGSFFLLTADKGLNCEVELEGSLSGMLQVHGSFSMMVNYHAMQLFAEQMGGRAMHALGRQGSLVISGFQFGADCPETRLAFRQFIDEGGPHAFHDLQKIMTAAETPRLLGAMLATLRLGAWDPELMVRLAPLMHMVLSEATPLELRQVRDAVARVVPNIFSIGDRVDVYGPPGALLYALGEYEHAIAFFEQAIEELGLQADTLYQLALCRHALGDTAGAVAALDASLELDPSQAPAAALRRRIADAPT